MDRRDNFDTRSFFLSVEEARLLSFFISFSSWPFCIKKYDVNTQALRNISAPFCRLKERSSCWSKIYAKRDQRLINLYAIYKVNCEATFSVTLWHSKKKEEKKEKRKKINRTRAWSRRKFKTSRTHGTVIEWTDSLCLSGLHFQVILDHVRYVRRVGNDWGSRRGWRGGRWPLRDGVSGLGRPE